MAPHAHSATARQAPSSRARSRPATAMPMPASAIRAATSVHAVTPNDGIRGSARSSVSASDTGSTTSSHTTTA